MSCLPLGTICGRLRSAGRTMRRGMGVGPPKMTSANLGTEDNQCNMFRRFEQLYAEFYRSPDSAVREVLFRARKYMIDTERFLTTICDMDSANDVKADMNRFIENLEMRQLYEQSYIKDIPDESAALVNLKEELTYYIRFVYKYIQATLTRYRDTGCLDLDAWLDCGLGVNAYPFPEKAPAPWSPKKRSCRSRRQHRTRRSPRKGSR